MSAATVELRHATIREYARKLRLPTLGSQFVKLAEESVKQKLGPIAYLEALLGADHQKRVWGAITRGLTTRGYGPTVRESEKASRSRSRR
jgi:hypothetical protein